MYYICDLYINTISKSKFRVQKKTPNFAGYCQSFYIVESTIVTILQLEFWMSISEWIIIFRHFAVPGLSQDWLQQDSKGFATGAAVGLWLWWTAMANLTPQETTYKRLGLGLLGFMGLCPPRLHYHKYSTKTFHLSLTSFVVDFKVMSHIHLFHFPFHTSWVFNLV